MSTFRFSALDTWFFRESRPMETIGGSELASVFPPPPRTLLGAIRTAIGDNSGVDWKTFNKSHLLGNLIGFGDDLGPLKLSGPWLSWKGERLYPVPMFLLRKGDDFARMRIGDAAESSLGRVRLPEISQGRQGFKPMERTWINKIGLERLLAGQCVDKDHLFPAKRMFEEEARLGIARDNTTRIADDGLLYQTRHIRPKSDLAIEADIVLAQDSPNPSGLVRLGGEGRLAQICAIDRPGPLEKPVAMDQTRGIILLLLTPARFGQGERGWLPPSFKPIDVDGERQWKGQISNIQATVHAAILGKAQREGGWDMANNCPRPVQSLIPAGSAYYLTVDGDINSAIEAMHGKQIGDDQALGRGHVACALWNGHEY